jgi:hypothetical protein
MWIDKEEVEERSHQEWPGGHQQMQRDRSFLNVVSFISWSRFMICFGGSGTDILGNSRPSRAVRRQLIEVSDPADARNADVDSVQLIVLPPFFFWDECGH